jgi:hypothetical protein
MNIKYITNNKALSEAVNHCLTFSICAIDIETCASKKAQSKD